MVQDVGIEPMPAVIDRGLDLRANPANQAMVRRSGVEPASVGCRPTILVR